MSLKMSLRPLREESLEEKEKNLGKLIQKSIPSWNATWNMLAQANLESSKVTRRAGRRKSSELHQTIRRKITELVDKEEALIDLYRKAADAAKEREIKFRNKTALLMEQIKKDKNLMKIFAFPL